MIIKEIFSEIIALVPGAGRSRAETGDGLKTFLVQGSLGTFALRISATGLSFVTSIVLARLLGAEGYGIYTYAFAWSLLLVVFAVMGFDKLLIRYIAVYQAKQQWSLLGGIVRRSFQAVFAAALVLAAIAAAADRYFGDKEIIQGSNTFFIALTLVPLYSVMRLRQASLQGLNKVVSGQVPETVVQPVLFTLMILVLYFIFKVKLSASLAAACFVVSGAVALLVLNRMFQETLPEGARSVQADYETRLWVKTAVPLLFIDSMYVINSRADIIMLGVMKGAVPAGIYNVANRGAEFITFVLGSVNMVLAPTIAALHTQGDKERLQNIITLSARAVLLFSLPVALGLIFFGRYFLMIFGGDFVPSYRALAILGTAQLFNCAMGSVGLLLIMTGHQKQAAVGVAVSAAINVVLNALFIPRWGIEGAAAATAVSIIAWNSIFVVWVYKRLGYHTTALGKIGWLEKK